MAACEGHPPPPPTHAEPPVPHRGAHAGEAEGLPQPQAQSQAEQLIAGEGKDKKWKEGAEDRALSSQTHFPPLQNLNRPRAYSALCHSDPPD